MAANSQRSKTRVLFPSSRVLRGLCHDFPHIISWPLRLCMAAGTFVPPGGGTHSTMLLALPPSAGTGPLGPGKPCVSFKAYGPYIKFKTHKPRKEVRQERRSLSSQGLGNSSGHGSRAIARESENFPKRSERAGRASDPLRTSRRSWHTFAACVILNHIFAGQETPSRVKPLARVCLTHEMRWSLARLSSASSEMTLFAS